MNFWRLSPVFDTSPTFQEADMNTNQHNWFFRGNMYSAVQYYSPSTNTFMVTNEHLSAELIGNQYSSEPATNQMLPAEPASNQFIPSEPASNQFVPSEPGSNQFVPSEPASNQFIPSEPAVAISSPVYLSPVVIQTVPLAPVIIQTSPLAPVVFQTLPLAPAVIQTLSLDNQQLPPAPTTNQNIRLAPVANQNLSSAPVANPHLSSAAATNQNTKISSTPAANQNVPLAPAGNQNLSPAPADIQQLPSAPTANQHLADALADMPRPGRNFFQRGRWHDRILLAPTNMINLLKPAGSLSTQHQSFRKYQFETDRERSKRRGVDPLLSQRSSAQLPGTNLGFAERPRRTRNTGLRRTQSQYQAGYVQRPEGSRPQISQQNIQSNENLFNFVEECEKSPDSVNRRRPVCYKANVPFRRACSYENTVRERDMGRYWKNPTRNSIEAQPDCDSQENSCRLRAGGSKQQTSDNTGRVSNNKSFSHKQSGGHKTHSDPSVSKQSLQNEENKLMSLFPVQSKSNIHVMDTFKRLYWKIYECYTLVDYVVQKKSCFEDLTTDIWKRNLFNQPQLKVFLAKIMVWKGLQMFVDYKRQDNNYALFLLGSTLTGLSVSGSDMDLSLNVSEKSGVSERGDSVFHLECLKILLLTLRDVCYIKLISAKVPLLRFTVLCDQPITVDITCNSHVSVSNSQLIYSYVKCDWRLQPLHSVIKQWADCHGINNPLDSTLSNYSLTLLVINFLQCGVSPPVLPCLHEILSDELRLWQDLVKCNQTESFQQWNTLWTSSNEMCLGELLVNFFKFCSEFDFTQHIISVRLGRTLPRSKETKDRDWPFMDYSDLVIIEEPFISTNTAYAVYCRKTYDTMKSKFSKAAETLRNTMNLESLFK